MGKSDTFETLSVEGHEVRVTHPDKLYFSKQVELSKLDIVRYYLSVAPGALNGIVDRPLVLKRFVNGAEQEAFYQKRAPSDVPSWLRTATLSFPSGRTAEELVVDNAAGLAWVVNLGCLELHPHPVRSANLEHPDELRVDLDPGPGIGWNDVCTVALEVKALLETVGLCGWPKTSGSRGMHVNVRIEPKWTFTEVRRAALAFSRAIEKRAPSIATSKWWKEERHGVFLDYNQNAKDRTTCSAYSVRPLPDARVSTPLGWRRSPGLRSSGVHGLYCSQALCTNRRPACRDGRPARIAGSALGTRRSETRRPDLAMRPGLRISAKCRVKGSELRLLAPSRHPLPKSRVSRCRSLWLPTPPTRRRRSPDSSGWKDKHAEAAELLAPDDVLVDPCAAGLPPGLESG